MMPGRFRAKEAMKLGYVGLVSQLFQTVINERRGDKDTQTLVRPFERYAGVAITPKSEGIASATAHYALTVNE
jgi:hypothetical protein